MNTAGRFTGRAEEYARGRPSYPAEAVQYALGKDGQPSVDDHPAVGGTDSPLRVADVGAGTGLLTRLLVRESVDVIAIEPNAEMAQACREFLTPTESAGPAHDSSGPVDAPAREDSTGTASWSVVVAPAESTGLADHCVDAVTVAQAFHWFDADAVAREFRRILRPGGRVAVLWNQRRSDGNPFAVAYEQFLRQHGIDYEQVAESWDDPVALQTLFGVTPSPRSFLNQQVLDAGGLRARVVSSSYMPGPDHPRHAAMVTDMKKLFDEHAREGRVVIEYDTVIYAGRLLDPGV